MSGDSSKPTRRVTIRDVAREAGVSVASVSHAFRGARNVSTETRKRILEVAEQMGYRPHPMVSALMSEVRGRRAVDGETVVAMLDFFTGGGRLCKTSRMLIYEGATVQAAKLGFRLDLFEPAEEGWSLERLASILQARGINGLIVPPLPNPPNLPESFPWEDFCVVTVGFTCHSHAFHSVVPDHLGGMELMLREIGARGYQRIGLYISADLDRRVRHAWSSLHLWHNTYDIRPAARGLCHFYENAPDPAHVQEWVQRKELDAVITDFSTVYDVFKRNRALRRVGCASLIGPLSASGMSGINQNYALEGAAAIDLLSTQLYRNTRGTPPFRMQVQVEPTWMEGKSLRKRPAARRGRATTSGTSRG